MKLVAVTRNRERHMSSLSNVRLPRPKDWQDFERKTRELFARVLADPNTRMHGRSGQPQHGVDIWGYRNEDLTKLVGVQCKLSNDEIAAAELTTELEKAKGFIPAISEFFLVTTAARDGKIQQVARELTQSLSGTARPIRVEIWGWDDIEETAAKYAEAWKIFDPTFNPFAEQARDEARIRFDTLDSRLESIDSKVDTVRPPAPSGRAPPFILPYHETPSFTGREEEIAALESALLGDRNDRVCTIAGLSGTGGIGKSALAVHFATLHRSRFPDGVIGLRVDGKDNDTIAREFARNAGETIDADDERDASSIMQSMFGARQILLIFDNAEESSLRELIPGGRSTVIITTRKRDLPISLNVPCVDVPQLPEAEGVQLLQNYLTTEFDNDIDSARKIVRLLGGLPLAIEIIAALLKMAPWRQTKEMADILADERQRLSTLAVRDAQHLDVRVSFNASLRFLKNEEIDFFACLSVCDADSFAVRSAAAAGGRSAETALESLGYLYRLSLVNRPVNASGTRFVLHPLLRSFASEICDERNLAATAKERHARYFIDLVKSIDADDNSATLSIADDMGETLSAARWLLSRQNVDYPYLIRLEPLLQRFGLWHEAAELMARFLPIAEDHGDLEAALQIRIQQAKFLQRLGNFEGAIAAVEQVAAGLIDGSPASLRVQGMFLNTYGGALQRLGRFQEAADALERSKAISEQMGDERSLAMVLNSLGGVLQRLGKFQEAADALERAKEIAERMDNQVTLAMVLNSLGGVLQRLGRFQEAADALERSKAIAEQMGDERSLAMVLNSLGGVLQRLGKFHEAADALQRSKTISEQMGDERSTAMVLNSLGGVLQRLGKFQEAAIEFRRSAAIGEKLENSRHLAMVLNSLGGVLQRLGKFQEAADALAKASEIEEGLGNERGQAMVLNSLGGVLQRLGRFQEAADALTKASEIEERLGNERGQAMVLNSLGGVLEQLGSFQNAADTLQRSHHLLVKQGDERGQAMALNSLGGVLQRLGKFQEAADALTKASEIEERLGNERGQAMVLNSLGGVWQRLGKFQEAADALTNASEIEKRLRDERGQAMVLNSLGGVLQRLGRFQEAADALERSKAISEQMGDERSLAMVLNSLGGVLQRLGKFQEAADALERAKEIAERMDNQVTLAMVLNSLGGVLQRLGRFQEAADALERSKAIAEQMGDERSLAMVLNSLGGVLQRLGKFHEAADALQRSKTISEQMGDERSTAMVLNSLGGVLQRLGKFHEAADALQRAKEIAERMDNQVTLAMVLNSLGGVLQRLRRFQEAADALERSKAIAEQMGDERSLAMVLNSLGGVLQRLGKFQEAADALERSHEFLGRQGDERGQAMVLNSLGGALQRLGRPQDADRAFTASIALGVKLNDGMHLAKVRTGFGKALVTRGEIAAGVEQLRQGFVLDEDKRNKKGMTIVAPLLINVLRQQGRREEADEFLKRAIAVAPYERSIERLVSGQASQSSFTASTRLTGKIKRLLEPLGRPRYGFFTSDVDGKDVYFSERQIGADVFSALSVDQPVEADVISASDGKRQAQAIRTLI
jgi:tetratricopeptide (TPR) repeat protein